jgi:DNA-binding CsgD family transcriptional regulator
MIRNTFINILLLILFKNLFSQNLYPRQYEIELKKILSLKYADPQSALSQLKALSDNNPNIPDSLKGGTFIEIGLCYAILNRTDSAILMTRKALSLIPINLAKVQLYRNLGSLYQLQNDQLNAQSGYFEALSVAQILKDSVVQAAIYGDLAGLYTIEFKYDSAALLVDQALSLAQLKSLKNEKTGLGLQAKSADLFMAMGEQGRAAKIYEDLMGHYLNSRDFQNYYTSCLSAVRARISLREYKTAEDLITRAYQVLPVGETPEWNNGLRLELIRMRVEKGLTESGLELASGLYPVLDSAASPLLPKLAIQYLKLLAQKGDAARGLLVLSNEKLYQNIGILSLPELIDFKRAGQQIYQLAGNLNQSTTLLYEVLRLSDSLHNMEMVKQHKAAVAHANYLLAKKSIDQEKEFTQLNEKQHNLRFREKLYWGIMGLLLLIIFILFWAFSRYKRKLNERENQQKEEIDELLILKSKLEEEEKIFKEVIINQQKTELLNVTQEVNRLETEMARILEQQGLENKEQLIIELNKIKEERNFLDMFMEKFSALLPEFTKKLGKDHVALTRADLQFCALLRMNLTYKEIAAILNIELTSVYRKKYRIVEKIKLEEDSSLEKYIMQL